MSDIVYDYVEEVDANLTCAICQSALVDPVTTSTCKHTYCRDCITRAISVNPTCPIDRSALSLHSLRDTEQLVKLMLDELKVRCLTDGCGLEMQRGLLLGHSRTCPKSVITCTDGDCGVTMTRNRQQHHRAYECFQRKMECGKCGVTLTFRTHNQSHHHFPNPTSETCPLCLQSLGEGKNVHPWTCPLVRMPCPHRHRGCPFIIVRSALPAHLLQCPFEAMSAFFQMNDARFSSIEERQNKLERENETLKRKVEELSSGLMVARHSLGSMWRTQIDQYAVEIPQGSVTRRGELEEPNDDYLESNGRGTRSDEYRARLSHLDGSPPPGHPFGVENVTPVEDGTSVPPGPTAEELARSLEGLPISPVLDQTSSIPNYFDPLSPTPPRQNYVDWTFNRFSSTGTGLDELISGLRTVVVHLASGIDTLERRSEIRRWMGHLRLVEEVDSLRSIVNTLRTQVMMDRSSSVPTILRPPLSARHIDPSIGGTRSSPISSLLQRPVNEETPFSLNASTATSSQRPATPSTPSASRSQRLHAIDTCPPSDQDPNKEVEGEIASVRESVIFSNDHLNDTRSSASIFTSHGSGSRSVPNSARPELHTVQSSVSVNGRQWSGRPMGIPELDDDVDNVRSTRLLGPIPSDRTTGLGSIGRNGANRIKRASTFGRNLLSRRASSTDVPRV